MEKMKKISEIADALHCAAALVGEAADVLTEMFTSKEAQPTLEAVRAVLREKSRAGFTKEIHALLEKYGAPKLSEIDSANYAALLKDVEGLHHAE